MLRIIRILVENGVCVDDLWRMINSDTAEICDLLHSEDKELDTLLMVMKANQVMENSTRDSSDYILEKLENHFE